MSAQHPTQTLNPQRLSWPMRLLLKAASRIRHGSLEIQLPDGQVGFYAGPEAGPAGVIRIEDPAFFSRLIKRGDLGFAEAYMAGEWTTPNLSALLTCLDRNLDEFSALERGRSVLRWLNAWKQRIFLRNSRNGSRRNIAYHYDLGNDFYRLWLDPSMTYSSANFINGDETLSQGQENKYESLLALTNAKPGDHILEIGCGWGGFALYAARVYGCRVTAITLSQEQWQWARQQVQEAGLADQITIRLQDYRDVEEQFDHIVSIEMFEAVGETYWPVFFQTLRDRLRPGGRAALQVITIHESVFDNYRRDVDFIREYIFPGGMLPSAKAFESEAQKVGLKQTASQYRGHDYACTLSQWAQRFSQAEERIRQQGFDQHFIRMWHYYLAYCEAGFHNGRIDLMQTVLEHESGG